MIFCIHDQHHSLVCDKMRNIKLVLEYDGTNYNGWQSQPNLPTVQGVVEQALKHLTDLTIPIIGAGRTDAGVHAEGQVANFHTNSRIPIKAFSSGLNSFLPRDVVVCSATEVKTDFHARFSAISRQYRYTILNRSYPTALMRKSCHYLQSNVNIDIADAICQCLIGTYNFSSFQKTGSNRKNPICNFYQASCRRYRNFIYFDFKADSFLRGMVRAIVGTILKCIKNSDGSQVSATAQFNRVIKTENRSFAGPSVPACGLSLISVNYCE